ncbi:MAG: hypothetical protein C5B60_03945 [Chloroflexi bacterium]|nr:MAG: hypothetical protein C5B60_03945 [Chloroflexota bacterium]
MLGQSKKRKLALLAIIFIAAAMLATFFVFGTQSRAAAPTNGNAKVPVSLNDLHALIFVWASGTPAVQRVAQHTCAQVGLTAEQCAGVSSAVRTGWLDMATRDPAAVGHVGARPNTAGRSQALQALADQLATVTGGRTSALLAATHAAYATISQPGWIATNVAHGHALPAGMQLVWATSFQQSSLPRGLSSRKSPYVALPDAYLKFANWGSISSIPSLYQSYYAPTGGTANWTVDIATADGTRSVANVLITEVGPWNEDDNWWDPSGTSTTLPASCPVSTTLVAPDATSNALVDGICPNGANLRRIYYYLLYQHDGLPFFQSAGYAPSGNFQDGTAWPLGLAQNCAEAAAASVNADGITCYGGPAGYNANNGGWLRSSTFDGPVLNQSSIDLSPGVDKALGWVYPSSGLVQVYLGGLP